jgi:hypothetical protein
MAVGHHQGDPARLSFLSLIRHQALGPMRRSALDDAKKGKGLVMIDRSIERRTGAVADIKDPSAMIGGFGTAAMTEDALRELASLPRGIHAGASKLNPQSTSSYNKGELR